MTAATSGSEPASSAMRRATAPNSVVCAVSWRARWRRVARVSSGSGVAATAIPALRSANDAPSAASTPCLFLKRRKMVTSLTPARSASARVVVPL